MIKTTHDKCTKLTLNENDIKKYRKKISDSEEDYMNILREENIEQEIRKADMETKKIENMIEHKDEIFNRPKKLENLIKINLIC